MADVVEMLDKLYTEMRRRMEQKRYIDEEINLDWLPIDDTQVGVEFAFDFLRARLSELEAEPAGGGVVVKALRWKRRRRGSKDFYVETDVGEYCAGLVHGHYMAIRRLIRGGQLHDEVLIRGFDVDAAKAAAQADYEARIRAVLAPPSPSAGEMPEVERVECEDWSTGYAEPADPIWRIVLDGYCADFPSEQAARNFASAVHRRATPAAEHHRTVEKLEAAEGQIARLKAALRPFANLGVGSGPDDEHDSQPYRILRGAIRHARSTLASLEPKEPSDAG